MIQKSTLAAGGNIDATGDGADAKPKFTKGMKWLKLGVDKDPEFGKQCFLYGSPNPDVELFTIGELSSITATLSGKEYSWHDDDGSRGTWPTHYCIPKPPID